MKYIFFLFLLIVLLLLSLSFILTHRKGFPRILGDNNREIERKSQYECGLELFEESLGLSLTSREYLKYYLISLIFLIFDLEALLLYPSTFFLNSLFSSSSPLLFYFFLFFFILIILLGLYYEYLQRIL